MDASEREQLTLKSTTLRTELKTWERDFAAKNDGRKAGREDVKQHPAIGTQMKPPSRQDLLANHSIAAQKYTEYNKLRDILSGKIPPPSRSSSPHSRHVSKKRKPQGEHTSTPPKRRHVDKTPTKPLHPAEIDPYDSPSLVRKLFTPAKKSFLGPTPQKDGQVLGLFDLLSSPESSKKPALQKTPSKSLLSQTPRKRAASSAHLEETPSQRRRFSKTPTSESKRRMLDAFATPMKRKGPDGKPLPATTPSRSVSKLEFATPAFLRRDYRPPLETLDENAEFPASPEIVRRPRKPIVRGLSSILADLRKMEDDARDEELDVLREMENEAAGITKPTQPKAKAKANGTGKEEVQVEDSQANMLLSGFDDVGKFDSEDETGGVPLGADGQPMRERKKKGQKRTTRRVKMKPPTARLHKPAVGAKTTEEPPTEDSEDELAAAVNDEDEEAVAETQLVDDDGYPLPAFQEGRNFASDSEDEPPKRDKDGKIIRAMKKVKATAHANFKRLKLRNTGSKGGPAHNSRFRRKK